MKLRWLSFLLLVNCGAGNGNTEFAPCSNEACVPPALANQASNVLCKSTCAFGFACVTSGVAFKGAGMCMRTCTNDGDCTQNYYPKNPPLCSHKIDFSDVPPAGWCVDLPMVIQ